MKQPKFKSNFEINFADLLKSMNMSYVYEPDKFDYTVVHTYTPDFKITSDIYVETKGVWDGEGRNKLLTVRKQHPGLQIIMCFQNPNLKLSKTSKTTYRQWADKHGFIWCTADAFSIRNAINKAFSNRMYLTSDV